MSSKESGVKGAAASGAARGKILQDDAHLHKLCQEGKLKKVQDYVNTLEPDVLELKLDNHKGVFGYTPLHESVANGKNDILDFLLSKGGDVNCRANSGYTPLHLAASSGHGKCVTVLLRHDADIGSTDEFGKTPKQTAELSSKASIVKLLRSEGQSQNNNIHTYTHTGRFPMTAVLFSLSCVSVSYGFRNHKGS